jgi:CheY-like chemotaxis protein
MPSLARILLVDDMPAEWLLALSGIGEDDAKNQTSIVRDKDEAMDFLRARGAFRRRASGLPAVVVVGPNVRRSTALSLLKEIRADANLRRVPVVIVATAPDADMVSSAYAEGVNSLVLNHEDRTIRAERYAELARFWGWANEPPPGCLSQSRSHSRSQARPPP